LFQAEVNWWHVKGNVTCTEIVLPPGAISTNHIFGIGLQMMDGYSSGIVWQACTYQQTSSLYSSTVGDNNIVKFTSTYNIYSAARRRSLPSVNNLKPGSSKNHIRTLLSEHSLYRQLTLNSAT